MMDRITKPKAKKIAQAHRITVRLSDERYSKLMDVAIRLGCDRTKGLHAVIDSMSPAAVVTKIGKKKSTVLTDQGAHSAFQGVSQS